MHPDILCEQKKNFTAATHPGQKIAIKNMACPTTGMQYNLGKYFRMNGYLLTQRLEEADYIIVITCAVVGQRTARCINYIHNRVITRRKKGCKILVMGCLPKLHRNMFDRHDDVVCIRHESDIDAMFASHITLSEVGSYNLFSQAYHDINLAIYNVLYITLRNWRRFPYGSFRKDLPHQLIIALLRLFISIKTHRSYKTFYIIPNSGCLGKCSYCAIRCAIGTVRSKPLEEIITEIKRGIAAGFTYFKIQASDLSYYGTDIGSSFLELLDTVTGLEGNYLIDFTYINPTWIIANRDSFISILKRGRIRGMVVSIQSGSQRILDLMNRKYDIEELKGSLRLINKEYPNVQINTAIIVGFPSETEEDFQKTRQLLRSARFARIFIYRYSERPNTPAAFFPDKLSPQILRKRFYALKREYRFQDAREFVHSLVFDFFYDFGSRRMVTEAEENYT